MEQLGLFSQPAPETAERRLKRLLDRLVAKYCTPDFIPNDPVKFVHRYSDERDREVIGLISAVMAQGKRTEILASMEKICRLLEDHPFESISRFDPQRQGARFANFNHFAYHNITGRELVCLFYLVRQVLERYGSLRAFFLSGYDPEQPTIKEALIRFSEGLCSFQPPPGFGVLPDKVHALVPSPARGSACKRLNMYLRWMVRRDCVDLGLWSEVSPSKLIIPLDIHVSRLSRQLGLTSRKSDDWKTAEEITARLRAFDPDDPVKYDFAIFGMGVSGEDLSAALRME